MNATVNGLGKVHQELRAVKALVDQPASTAAARLSLGLAQRLRSLLGKIDGEWTTKPWLRLNEEPTSPQGQPLPAVSSEVQRSPHPGASPVSLPVHVGLRRVLQTLKIDTVHAPSGMVLMTIEHFGQLTSILSQLDQVLSAPSTVSMAHVPSSATLALSLMRELLHQLVGQAGYTSNDAEWKKRSVDLLDRMIKEEVRHVEDMPFAAVQARLMRTAAVVGLALLGRLL